MKKILTLLLVFFGIVFVSSFVINFLPIDIFNSNKTDQVDSGNNQTPSTLEDNNSITPETPSKPETPEVSKDVVYSETIAPKITINSSTGISYSISNVLNSVTLIDIKVLDASDNSVVKSLISLNGNVDNIDSTKTYLITGSYMGLKDKVSTVVNLSNISFSTNSYQELSLITKEEAVSNVYANSLEINTTQYVESAPEGYSLKGFTLTDKNDVVKDIAYNGEAVLYVDGLSANTEYLLGYYYENDAETSTASQLRYKLSIKKLNKYEVTPGYRIHFVGYWIISGNKKANRVRMQYKGETLYTYYLEDNDTVDNIQFVLPIKYDDYNIYGATPYPRNVTSNMDCELILISTKETGPYSVLFYNELGDPYHIEQVEEGQSAVGPSVLPKDMSYDKYDSIFKGWNVDISNITRTTRVWPKYENVYRNPSDDPENKVPYLYNMDIFVGADYIYYDKTIYYSNNANSIKLELIESNGTTMDIYTSKDYKIYDYKIADDITIKLTITYKILDQDETEDVYEWKIDYQKFLDTSTNDDFSLKQTSYTYVEFNVPEVGGKLYTIKDSEMKFVEYDHFCNLKMGTTYEFKYAIQDELNSSINYILDKEISATTKTYSELGVINIYGDIESLEFAYVYIETNHTEYLFEEVVIYAEVEENYIEICYEGSFPTFEDLSFEGIYHSRLYNMQFYIEEDTGYVINILGIMLKFDYYDNGIHDFVSFNYEKQNDGTYEFIFVNTGL